MFDCHKWNNRKQNCELRNHRIEELNMKSGGLCGPATRGGEITWVVDHVTSWSVFLFSHVGQNNNSNYF